MRQEKENIDLNLHSRRADINNISKLGLRLQEAKMNYQLKYLGRVVDDFDISEEYAKYCLHDDIKEDKTNVESLVGDNDLLM